MKARVGIIFIAALVLVGVGLCGWFVWPTKYCLLAKPRPHGRGFLLEVKLKIQVKFVRAVDQSEIPTASASQAVKTVRKERSDKSRAALSKARKG